MEDISKIFGNKVRALRKAKNLSQEEYAEFVGVNLKTLWNIETGKRSIRFDTIKKIAGAENIPVYHLFMSEDEEKEIQESELCDKIRTMCTKLNANKLDVIKNLLEMLAEK